MNHVLRYAQSSWAVEIDSYTPQRVEDFLNWRWTWDDEYCSRVTRVRLYWGEYNIIELGVGD